MPPIHVADILKVFNPDLYGFSEDYAAEDEPKARLNRAVSGSTVKYVIHTALVYRPIARKQGVDKLTARLTLAAIKVHCI